MSTDRLSALLEAPGIERASRLITAPVPVLPALADVLPERGLRPGSVVSTGGVGATSLAMALVAEASKDSWTAVVGMPSVGLRAGAELGVDLDRVVVLGQAPGEQIADVLSAVIDAFDIVITRALAPRITRKITGRIRERDAVVVSVGDWGGSDLELRGTSMRWHGIDDGHGHLSARTIDVNITGRRGAARGRRATLWLPDPDGEVSLAHDTKVVSLAR